MAEGLPNTVLEAMACGLPTVLSDIPSHNEIYEDIQGAFFQLQDSKGLSVLLNKIVQDPNIQKDASLKLIKKNFCAKTMSEKYQKLYIKKLINSDALYE